jgi:hypothetical protein
VCFKGIEYRLLELMSLQVVIRLESADCVLQNKWGIAARLNLLESAILYCLAKIVLEEFVLAVPRYSNNYVTKADIIAFRRSAATNSDHKTKAHVWECVYYVLGDDSSVCCAIPS